MSTRVLIAFDKFKDALTAQRAGAIAARELGRLRPDWIVDCVPVAECGYGFVRILTEAAAGAIITVPSTGPRLEAIDAPLGFVEWDRLPATARALLPVSGDRGGRVAVIEMAAVNGLTLLPLEARDPWYATSVGTGRLIRTAAELGATAILLGVGGSATNDLGIGALSALGFVFRDANAGKFDPPFPATWERITEVEGELLASIPPLTIACDVSNPLLGPNGAAAVYGPQKGLCAADLPRYEAQAAWMADLLCRHCGRDLAAMIGEPGAGAAGGIAFGLMAAAQARLVPGFDLVAAWLQLDAKIVAADIVITGEGRFDTSSLAGKGPGEIVRRARAAGRRAVVFAGTVDAETAVRDVEVVAITPLESPLDVALAQADRNLAAAVARWAS